MYKKAKDVAAEQSTDYTAEYSKIIYDTKELDIDSELEKIIEKYQLDRYYPAYRVSRQACEYIRKWVNNLHELDKKILFITMDNSVLWMIRSWAMGENISVFQISAVEELNGHIMQLQYADKIYIIAYTRTVEILHWLWRHDFEAESVYDILENRQIFCQMEFYRFFSPFILNDELGLEHSVSEVNTDGTAWTLYEYYYQKQRLRHCGSEEDKRRLSEKLFFLAICMRNFIEAERLLETLSYSEEYKKCWREIEILLDKIKRILREKKQKHIIIYWLDCLSYEDAEKLEYLQEQRRHSLYFQNAFAVTPFTFPALKAMLFGIKQTDDLGYQIRRLELEKSPFLQEIKRQGYECKILSNYINRRVETNYNCDYYGRQMEFVPCSELFWGLTRQMVQDIQPTVYLTHSTMELHIPRLSVRRDRYEQEYGTRPGTWRVQFEELNGQLRFYDQMIGDSPYRIYMGDHGAKGSAVNKLHICFQVYHSAWRNKEVDKLFCYLDFPKVIHRLLIGEEIDDTTWNREFVPIQDVDFYNPVGLKKHLTQRVFESLLSLVAYKGVVTSEYVYAYFKTGDEIFHRWSHGKYVPFLNFNNTQQDKMLIKELRKKVGDFPKELDTDSQFKYSKNIYGIWENVKKTTLKAVQLLDEKLSGYAYGSIALRPGGYHMLQLCSVLSEDSRKKIGGIIDQDSACMCSDLGYSVYKPGDRLPDDIKAVLLSTYENLGESRNEADRLYSGLEVIDIYQYWRDYGYSFTKAFWFGLDSDWDIEFLRE